VALAGVNNFQMSSGGEKALYRQGENWMIAALRPAAAGPGGAPPPAGRRRGNPAHSRRPASKCGWIPPRNGSRCIAKPGRSNATGFTTATHPRPGPERGGEEVRGLIFAMCLPAATLTYLFQEMLGNITVSHMGTGGRRPAGSEAGANGAARRRLRGDQWQVTASSVFIAARIGTRNSGRRSRSRE